jgi:acetyltransferase
MPLPVRLAAASGPGFRDTALFRPRHVLLVADPALPRTAVLAANLLGGGFKGCLSAVAPAPDGFEAAESIAAVQGSAPDLAVLSLPADRLEPVMAELAARGCFAAVVTGPAPELAAIARRTGVRALGPDSFGLVVPGIGLNASLSHVALRPGRLALVCQGHAIARTLLDWAAAESVGFSHVIGVGGNAELGFAPSLDWLSRDAGTGAVLLDLRRIRNRRAFISAARAAARTRPVVALRAGGRMEDASGISDAVMEAALRRAGVLRVEGLEDLLAAAETLARVKLAPRLTPGDRIAVVANGIGLGKLGADAVVAGGGRLAELPDTTAAALSMAFPGWSDGNPFSLGPAMAGTRLGDAAAALASLSEVDAVVALHAPVPGEDGAAVCAALAAAAKASRSAPVLVGWAGHGEAGAQRLALAEAGLAVFATPEAAVRGALHLAQDRRNRAAAAELPPREVLELKPDRDTVRRLFDRLRREGRRAPTEDEALSVLAAYGVPVVPGRVATGPEEAGAAAAMLGFPCVLKIRSADLPRKTEVGGVALGLRSAAAVEAAARGMLERVAQLCPEARVDGFLVQRQAARAQELRLRLGDDAMFGPWIGFGLGGTAADLIGDEGFDLPPLNRPLATALIGRTRAARLLRGYRDHPPASIPAVADALVRLSQIAVDFPEIATIAINPLFADAEGVLAIDCSMELRPEGEAGLLAIPPYPQELAHPWWMRGGEELLIRPIRPEDATALAEAFRRLRPEDVRWRFFSQLRELPPAQVARLTQIDYEREMAFVATRRRADGAEEILGTARLIREPDGESGEFAVVVDPSVKNQGLGRHLMGRIFDWGRAEGLRRVAGQVLADNAPMLSFVRALGFTAKRAVDDEEVYEVTRSLEEPI